MFRTVQEFERAGVAAIHVEDQVFPKKCGHLENKELVSREDYVAKIRAAAAAKRTPDFTIIARTDSRAVVGFDEAIIRANLALANGADAVFVEAPQTMEEVEQVPKLVKGPCLLNMVRGGKTPEIPLADAERMGYAISILPGLSARQHHRDLRPDARRGEETRQVPAAAGRVLAGQDVCPFRRRRLGCPSHRVPRRAQSRRRVEEDPSDDRPADHVREDLAAPRRGGPAGWLHAALCRPSPDA